jgi:plastocyanin
MNKYLISLIALIALVSVAVTGYLLFNKPVKENTAQNTTAQSTTAQNTQKINNAKVNAKYIPAKTVTLTSSGFVPQTLTIKADTRVVWINSSGVVGSVNSDNYPTNLLYPFLNFGQFNNGSSFSTVFQKAGTYAYYNFPTPSQKGTIIVK